MLKNKKVVKSLVFSRCVFKFNPNSKIIKFYKKPDGILSDEDINALVIGLLNLIKNNAIKKVEITYKQQVKYYQDLLSLNLNRVIKLERELKKLKGKQFS
ncbi:MAG: hypothetical protein IJE91_02620 [Clostridia bacterium]|nr:hypothetical protein [Clostridia bacterium]